MTDEKLIDSHLQVHRKIYRAARLANTPAGKKILAADTARAAAMIASFLKRWRALARSKSWSLDDSTNRDVVSRGASELLQRHGKSLTAEQLLPALNEAAQVNRNWLEYFPSKALAGAVEKHLARQPLAPALREGLIRWRDAISPRKLTAAEKRKQAQAEAYTSRSDYMELPYAKFSAATVVLEEMERITSPLKPQRQLIERLNRLIGAKQAAGAVDKGPKIDPSDAVGTAIAADRAPRGRATSPAWSALLSHAKALSGVAPSEKWNATAARLVAEIDAKQFAACVADWMARAGAKFDRHPYAKRYPKKPALWTLLNDSSVDLLKGLAWSIASAGRVDLAPAVGTLADQCFEKVRDVGPRNVKVGNAAVAALAALAKPEAAAQLSRVRTRVRHPSSRKAIDKALADLSRRTGQSIDDLLEVGIPAHLDEEMLAAQKVRIERLFLSDRTWPASVWRERYLDHPLVGKIARRLIWLIGDTPAGWDGKLLDVNDRPVTAKDKTMVRLWHPMLSNPAEVLAWRTWLQQHEVIQPFKQAHREVYVLTDAERKTKTYSNRFAAHILRQHQFAALARVRGWDYRLMGDFDSGSGPPTLEIPAHKLTAELWVESAGRTSESAIFLYIATDRVRFNRPLASVPKVVFSEVMRDADLFVGVASVGNDPNWYDGGPRGRYRDYWNSYSFGELNESARTRSEVLQQLLPRLKIASRCELAGRFLVVRGDLGRYKIHLGSGNVLMEPNDQYLCIVVDRRTIDDPTEDMFLPFEGDSTLSVILSKAFLLAADRKITDKVILKQIKR